MALEVGSDAHFVHFDTQTSRRSHADVCHETARREERTVGGEGSRGAGRGVAVNGARVEEDEVASAAADLDGGQVGRLYLLPHGRIRVEANKLLLARELWTLCEDAFKEPVRSWDANEATIVEAGLEEVQEALDTDLARFSVCILVSVEPPVARRLPGRVVLKGAVEAEAIEARDEVRGAPDVAKDVLNVEKAPTEPQELALSDAVSNDNALKERMRNSGNPTRFESIEESRGQGGGALPKGSGQSDGPHEVWSLRSTPMPRPSIKLQAKSMPRSTSC